MKECFTKRKIPNLLVTMKVPLSLILQQYEHFLRSQFYFFQILNLLLLLIYEFRPHLMLKLHVPIIKIYEEKFLRYFGSNIIYRKYKNMKVSLTWTLTSLSCSSNSALSSRRRSITLFNCTISCWARLKSRSKL